MHVNKRLQHRQWHQFSTMKQFSLKTLRSQIIFLKISIKIYLIHVIFVYIKSTHRNKTQCLMSPEMMLSFHITKHFSHATVDAYVQNSAVSELWVFLQAPCRAELQRALDRLASNTRTHDDLFTIPIPNCDKNGDFHAKQVCDFKPSLIRSFIQSLNRSLFGQAHWWAVNLHY